MRIDIHAQSVEILDWENRHFSSPNIKNQVAFAQSNKRFQVLFRGCKKIPYVGEVFNVGYKACPAFHGGDISKLEYTFRELTTNIDKFQKIAECFLSSPMHQRSSVQLTIKVILEKFRKFDEKDRFLLSQLLVFGLHYQNCRAEVEKWKDYLFVISFTEDEAVALKYAASHYNSQFPVKAYVLEYACPIDQYFYVPVSEVINKFSALNLGYIFPDKDREFFVFNAALPHYLLGYTELTKDNSTQKTYSAKFFPNPYYEEKGYNLENPPNLSEVQNQLIKTTNQKLAWVFHDGIDWSEIRFSNMRKKL